MAKVGIVMGSDSDMPVMSKAAEMLDKFGISYEMTIISAHREPDVFFEYAKTAEAKWMAEHCHEYGFVIRYQSDKQAITGINYEPWHLRYVGTECAAYMKANNLSLEEFTEEWQAYVASYNAKGGDFEGYCKSILTLPDPVGLDKYDKSGDEEMSFFFPGS